MFSHKKSKVSLKPPNCCDECTNCFCNLQSLLCATTSFVIHNLHHLVYCKATAFAIVLKVPQEKVVQVTKEVDVVREVVKEVKVPYPVERFVEKHVKVPREQIVEKEVPYFVEKIVERVEHVEQIKVHLLQHQLRHKHDASWC